jgi:hypothetical protein
MRVNPFKPEGDREPPFKGIKGNLTQLRYSLLDVEARTRPIENILKSVTQALIEKVPGTDPVAIIMATLLLNSMHAAGDNSEFSSCWNGKCPPPYTSIVELMNAKFSGYLAPLYEAETEAVSTTHPSNAT